MMWHMAKKKKDLVKRIWSDKVLKDPKYDGYQIGLASMVYKFFDKKSASLIKSKGSGIANKSASEPNYQLADELHKPIIKKI